jgi:hypothetical protein
MNALKHGCRSHVLLMPDEDPEAIAGLFASWQDFYRPQSPAAEHLLDLCVRAKLMSDRAFTAHDSATADQVEEAIEAFDAARAAMVAEQEDLLADEPAAARAALASTGAGCRLLIDRIGRHRRALQEAGYLRPGACTAVVRLLGAVPEPGALRQSEAAFRVMLWNLGCQPATAAADRLRAEMVRPENRPPELARAGTAALLDSPEACREELLKLLDGELAGLRAAEEALRTGRDAEAKMRVVGPTRLIQDDKEGNKFFRYHAESRSTFLRAYKLLETTLERDAQAGRDDDEDCRESGASREVADPAASAGAAVPPNEPSTAVSPGEPGAAISPNEPTTEVGDTPEVQADRGIVVDAVEVRPAAAAGPGGRADRVRDASFAVRRVGAGGHQVVRTDYAATIGCRRANRACGAQFGGGECSGDQAPGPLDAIGAVLTRGVREAAAALTNPGPGPAR